MAGWRGLRLAEAAVLLLLLAERALPQEELASTCPEQCAPGSEPAAAGAGGCVACPAGRVSWGGTQPCEQCEVGRVPTPEQSYCTRCVAGEQPNADRTTCERCPAGQVALTSQAECVACAQGRVTNSEQSECELCPPGKESVAEQCENCTAGRYSTHESMCSMCPEGHVPSQRQDYCVRCVAGERPNANRTACERCPVGFISATTQSDCYSCPTGRIPNSEQSECEPCPPGCEAINGSQCQPCPAGNYSTLFGSCQACAPGHVPHVCDGDGERTPTCIASAHITQESCEPAGSCDQCDAGKAPNPEGTRCEPCSLGQVSLSGDHRCRDCPAGKVAQNSAACVVCQEGRAPNRMHLADRCDDCEPGRTANPGDTFCRACPDGHHSRTAGTDCSACLGKTEPNLDQTGCVCKVDHFNASLYPFLYPSKEPPECVPCDARTLGEIADRVTCPGGLWYPGGRASLFAVPGFWIGDWTIREASWAIELASDERKETQDLFAQLGFEAGVEPSIPEFVYYCSSPLVCPGFTLSGHQQRERPDPTELNSSAIDLNETQTTSLCKVSKDGTSAEQCIDGSVCAPAHTGLLCGTCSSPRGQRMQKLSDHRCAVCEGSSLWYVLALLLGWAMFSLFLDFKARQIHVHEDGAALGILTFFFQSLTLFADKKGDNAVYGLARLINMDLISAVENDEGTPQCLLDIGPTGAWLMSSVWVPLYLCFCSAVVLKLQEASYARRIAEDMPEADRDKEDGGKVSQLFEKVRKKYTAATNLNFLRLRVLYRADNAGLSNKKEVTEEARALLTWWRLSCVVLKKKMIRKHRFRMLLEVAMFTYMGVTKGVFRVIPGVTACLHINGKWYSSMDVQMSCSDTIGVQVISVLLLCSFTVGFPFYIMWRVGEKMDAIHEGNSDAIGKAGPKAARFTTMVRVAYIFTSSHRGWMAYLMLRRVALVAFFQIGSMYGGYLPVPGTRGGHIDWRVLPFFVVSIFVLLQAWYKPFELDLDNTLEQTTLTMLLCVLYANVALTQPAWKVGSSELAPNLVVLCLAVLFVLAVWLSQRKAREQMQRVHQADFGSIVAKLADHYDAQAAHQNVERGEQLSEAALASLQRNATSGNREIGIGKAMNSIWTTGRKTVRLPHVLKPSATDEDLPAAVFDEKITAKTRVNRGLQSLSAEDLAQIDELKHELDVTSADVLRYFEIFSTFDKDGSGQLDVSELKQVFDMLGGSRMRNEDIIRALIADLGLDTDASGDISFPEFLKMMILEKKAVDQDEELQEAYKTFVQSRHQAEQLFGLVESDTAQHREGNSEPPITQKILLHQLVTEGVIDTNAATASEQEELTRCMLRVANRFAAATQLDATVNKEHTPDSVAFAAGAALGISQTAGDASNTADTFEFKNPIGDSSGGAVSLEQPVGYSAYRAMMIAIGDPSKVALDVALVNERSREALGSTVETEAAPPQRKRFVTVG